jgi:Cu+-exporting ATPase
MESRSSGGSPTVITERPPDASRAGAVEVALPIAGMTCASCVHRIERFLGKTPGVDDAAVNLATEVATIRYRPDVASRADLVDAIEAAGYDLKPTAGPSATDADAIPQPLDAVMAAEDAARAREQRQLAIQAGVSIGVATGS